LLPLESFDEDRYLVTFSKLGKVKKSPLSDYKTADTDGLLDMKLAESDVVVAALISRGQGEYFVTTDNAQTLRFSDENLRAQGRVGQGVACMTLAPNAKVVSASYLDSEEENTASNPLSLFVLTEGSLAKKVPVGQYPAKGRATGGVVTTELFGKDKVLSATIVSERQHFLIITNGDGSEQANVVKASEVKMFPRARKGVPLVKGHIIGVVELTS
jgi:DNA gyrase subunit A